MKWISVNSKQDLPRDRVFIALWKGRICMAELDQDDGHFYIVFEPAQYGAPWRVDHEREDKFTHWIELPNMPDHY